MWVLIGKPWRLKFLAYRKPIWPEPVEYTVETHVLPADWNDNNQVRLASAILTAAGSRESFPLYLQPSLKGTLKAVDLKTPARTTLHPKGDKAAAFEVEGVVPANARKGDTLLVKVTAHYPASGKLAARAVEFLEVLHVTDEKR